jgi:putative ABC transport system permease protein
MALRTETNPTLLVNAVRERVRAIDAAQPLARVVSMEEIVGSETVQPRFNVALFTFFGMVGLSLALVGIYSTLSYTVGRRTHEIGIRIALGAGNGDVLRLILAMGGRLLIIGVAAGVGLSLALLRLVRVKVIQFPQPDILGLSAVVVLLCGRGHSGMLHSCSACGQARSDVCFAA